MPHWMPQKVTAPRARWCTGWYHSRPTEEPIPPISLLAGGGTTTYTRRSEGRLIGLQRDRRLGGGGRVYHHLQSILRSMLGSAIEVDLVPSEDSAPTAGEGIAEPGPLARVHAVSQNVREQFLLVSESAQVLYEDGLAPVDVEPGLHEVHPFADLAAGRLVHILIVRQEALDPGGPQHAGQDGGPALEGPDRRMFDQGCAGYQPSPDHAQGRRYQLAPVCEHPLAQVRVAESRPVPRPFDPWIEPARHGAAGDVERQLGVVARRRPQRAVRQG